jgi:hypothetical protein
VPIRDAAIGRCFAGGRAGVGRRFHDEPGAVTARDVCL